MRRIFGIINLLLCIELIVGPSAPQFGMLLSHVSYAEDCPAGTEFDSTLNRCLTTEQTATIMNATSKCSPEDKACFKANAEEALKKAEEDGKVEKELKDKGGLMGSGMKAAAVAVPLFMAASSLFKGKQTGGGGCKTSIAVYMMLGGGAAIFLGDMLANKQHRKRLKNIRKEWEEKVKPNTTDNSSSANISVTQNAPTAEDQKAKATEAQSEAFEMLAKSEDSLAKAAKFKSMIYGIGTLAFGAATVVSVMEAMKKPPTPCTGPIPKGTAPAVQEPNPGGVPVSNPPPVKPVVDPGFRQGFNDSHDMNLESLGVYYAQSKLLESSQNIDQIFTLNYSFQNSLEKKSSPSMDDYYEYKKFVTASSLQEDKEVFEIVKHAALKIVSELNPIQTAQANPPSAAAPPVGAPQEAAQGMGVVGKMNSFLEKPVTRAVIAGIFTVWAGIMTMHARKQAKIAEARAEYLRSIKDTFDNATGAISCSTQERGNSANPRCYCYTPEGQRNPERGNSDICNKLWTGKSILAETNYLNGAGSAPERVCLTSAGVDENCACRTTNTCLSAMPNNFAGVNPGSLSMLSSGLAPFSQVTNGQTGAGQFNGASAVSNAAKMLGAARKLASKEPGLVAKMDQAAKPVADQLTTASSGGSAPMLGGGSSSMPFNMSPSQAAAQLEKELKKADSDIKTAKGGGTFSVPGNGKEEKLEFGMTQSDLAGQQTVLADVMDKKLDYGQNDIHTGSDTNLFEVLSNRYQRSGMRRLFDEEGKVPADKANKSDITP